MSPQRRRDEWEFDAWVEDVTTRLDPFMAWLGVLFALMVGFELAAAGDLTAGTRRGLNVAITVVWAIFLVDYVGKLYVAPRRLRFLRRHWLQALMLLLPALRLLRLGALLRLGRALPAGRVISSSVRLRGTARRLVRSRLSYLAGLSSIGVVATAQLAFLFERGTGTFSSFGDALLWALAAVVGVQASPVPETALGRLTMIAAFALGTVLVAALAGTLGAYFLEDRAEREGDAAQAPLG